MDGKLLQRLLNQIAQKRNMEDSLWDLVKQLQGERLAMEHEVRALVRKHEDKGHSGKWWRKFFAGRTAEVASAVTRSLHHSK